MIPESTIDPVDMESLDDVTVDDETAQAAIRTTAVIKLNGGLGTSMGMDRAKSLLCVRKGMSFLDIICRQVLHLRESHQAPLPLIFMNSFRTSEDTMAAVARYDDLPVAGLPLEFLQNKEPTLLAKDLPPVSWPKDPALEWCPATSTPRWSAPASSTTCWPPATSASSSPTPTTSARCPTRGWPAGSPRPVRPSRSRPCGAPRRTARAATSPVARTTVASCSARPRRPWTRTSRRSPTSTGTATARPTTCGSTCAR